MKFASWTVAKLLASVPSVYAYGEPDLYQEHHGDVFRRIHSGGTCDDGVLNAGNSTGTIEQYGAESYYIASPRRRNLDYAILYLTDVFGNALLNNRLLADNLARAGYLVVMPDLFRGDPIPTSAMGGVPDGFNFTAWSEQHPQPQIEEIIESALGIIRNEFNVSRIGAVGYCFGGKYVARFLAEGRGLDAGFTAHPSNTLDEEWGAIANPISIAFGDLDASNTAENRTNIESIFQSDNKTFQTSLYANAEHGFAVRTNLTDKVKAFAQESAYLQAVRWFDTWVKDEDEN